MDSESARIFERMQLYHLLKKYPEWTNQHFADELGKSESWVRKWCSRFMRTSQPNFKIYLSESCAPKTIWRETPVVMKNVIADMRVELSEQYHRKAGPKLILHELRKREGLRDADHYLPNSERTIAKILREMGYVVPPCHRERQPLVLPAPNEEWEMDFGQIRLDEETIFEFFLVVYLEGSTGYNAETALEAVTRLLMSQGLPKRLRFDRDSRFIGSWTRDSYPSPLVRFLRVLNVEPVVCPPYRPDKKPFVERTIKTLKREWLAKFVPTTLAEAHEVLPGFVHYHNAQRVHQGRACRNQIPDVAFPDLPPLPTVPETIQSNHWLKAYHRRVFRRRISSNGTIHVDRYTYYIDDDYRKHHVLVHLDAEKQVFCVSCNNEVLKRSKFAVYYLKRWTSRVI
jgi:hypothetical protein